MVNYIQGRHLSEKYTALHFNFFFSVFICFNFFAAMVHLQLVVVMDLLMCGTATIKRDCIRCLFQSSFLYYIFFIVFLLVNVLWQKSIFYPFFYPYVYVQYPKYPTSIAALSFSRDGRLLAVASSYTFEEGDKPYGFIDIFISISHSLCIHM